MVDLASRWASLLCLILPTAANCLHNSNEAAVLVQVEILIGKLAREVDHGTGRREPLALGQVAAVTRPAHVHAAEETGGNWYDLDRNFNFSAAQIEPVDPAEAERVMKTVHEYTAAAVQFMETAESVREQLDASSAKDLSDVKGILRSTFHSLQSKVDAFQSKFDKAIDQSLRCLPGPMNSMGARQGEKVLELMQQFVAPFSEMQQAVSESDGPGSMCARVGKLLAELHKHSGFIAHLNRQQALGSRLMLQRMPDSWRPWVNVSVVNEMGRMAAQTADSVENATGSIVEGTSAFLRERLHCEFPSAAGLLRLHVAAAVVAITGLLWL